MGELQRQITGLTEEIAKNEQEAATAKECGALVEAASRLCRMATSGALQNTLTEALRTVFGDDYACQIELVMHRGRPAATVMTTSGNHAEWADPVFSRGGGVIDILAFAARVAILEQIQPMPRGLPLILDEPMDALDRARSPEAGMLISKLSRATGRQILFVTHNRQLAQWADAVVDLEASSGA